MRTLVGILIVVFGLTLFLEQFTSIKSDRLFGAMWPLFIIIAGFLSLRSNRRDPWWPILIIAAGILLFAIDRDWVPGNFWNYFWPLILILIGLRVVTGKQWKPRETVGSGDGKDVFVAFSGHEERVRGAFTGGNVSAVFGGSKMDLRDADIQDGATLEVFAAFGGVEIFLPKNVHADISVVPLFGGASNKTDAAHDVHKKLRIRGTALFGGVDVKN